MIDDPITEEVRKHRQARASKFNYDIDAIANDARKRQGTGGHKVIQPPRKKTRRQSGRTGAAAVG
jgi:hypothetical protein